MAPVRPLHDVGAFFDRAAPRWAVRDFDRALMERLIGQVGLAPGDRVLDLGGGTGHLLPVLRQRVGASGVVCLVDLSMQMLRHAGAPAGPARAGRCCGLVEHLPLAGGRWNAAICMGLYPHFSDRRAALAEIRRALVPGGRLAVLHLIGREELNALHAGLEDVVADHLLPPGREVAASLAAAGFAVGEVRDLEDSFLVTARRQGTCIPHAGSST